MVVPMPFSRAIYVYGQPIPVPRDADVELFRERVEHALKDLAETAENGFESLWKEAAAGSR